ncbi:hypothetical protein FDUTEX481_06762 [Tolypothrix sp. PCC 7601]|nr:hypothetical protein FDUTEX481_06762 [Tolypothrix sp. PCC 7601]
MPLQSVTFFFPIGITQQKNRTIILEGVWGRNRHPIGGLGENPPILLASLISDTKSKNVCDASIYSRGRGTPCPYNLSHSFFQLVLLNKKTEQSFWRGFGGRNRHPIGGLGENPPILLASLISDTKSKNVCDASIYSRGRSTPCLYHLSHSFFKLVLDFRF